MDIEAFVVSNNPTLVNFLSVSKNAVPVSLECSSPISEARKNCIKNAKSNFVLFVDDDVKFFGSVLKQLVSELNDDVGAVEGVPLVKGLGKWFDYALNGRARSRELTRGQRGYTIVTLLRKTVVEDWNPPEQLTSYEDYDLTQHIIKKGYRWVTTPVHAFHFKNWRKLAKNCLWCCRGYKQTFTPNMKQKTVEVLKHLVSPFVIMIKQHQHSPFLLLYRIYYNWIFGFALILTS